MRISTAEIKIYLKECAMKKKNCTLIDFEQYLKQINGGDFTKGQLAGAIKQLTDRGELVRIERGCYKINRVSEGLIDSLTEEKTGVGKSRFVLEVRACLESTIKELSLTANQGGILDMSALEFELLGDIKKLKKDLEDLLLKYE